MTRRPHPQGRPVPPAPTTTPASTSDTPEDASGALSYATLLAKRQELADAIARDEGFAAQVRKELSIVEARSAHNRGRLAMLVELGSAYEQGAAVVTLPLGPDI